MSRGGALGGQGVPGEKGRIKEEGSAPAGRPSGLALGSPGAGGRGAAPRGPRFQVSRGRRDLSGGQEGQGLPSTALYAQARGASGRGTARERARSQLAPKIPNRTRVPAQERLLLRPLPDLAHQKAQSS